MSRTITTTYSAHCAECHQPIAPGDKATWTANTPQSAKIVCTHCQPIKKENN